MEAFVGTGYVWDGDSWVEFFAPGAGGGGDTAYADEVLADLPLAFWKLDEESGTTMVDSSGNGHSGTLVDTTPFATGPGEHRSTIFDGNSAAGLFDSTDFRTPEMTAEVWVATSMTDYGCILAHPVGNAGPYGYNLFNTVTSGLARMEFDNGSPQDYFSTTDINDATWHHVVMTSDGSTVKLYVDGVEEESVAQGPALEYLLSSTGGMIGAQEGVGGVGDYYFDGQLALVALYDYALDYDRVLAHYNAMFGYEAELIQEFAFGGGSTTGWTVVESWSQDPADWIYSAGSGSGFTIMERDLPVGTVYAETDVFMDHTGSEWVALRINHAAGGAVYDSTANGVLMRGNGNLAIPWSGGSDASVGAGDLPDAPHDSSEAVALGVRRVSNVVELYVDRVLRYTYTGSAARAGTKLAIGVYNGGAGHFNAVRCYTDLPA